MMKFNFKEFEDIIDNIEGIRPREFVIYMPHFLRELHPDQFYTGVFGETRLINLPYVTARFYPDVPIPGMSVDNSTVFVLPTDEKPIKVVYGG